MSGDEYPHDIVIQMRDLIRINFKSKHTPLRIVQHMAKTPWYALDNETVIQVAHVQSVAFDNKPLVNRCIEAVQIEEARQANRWSQLDG